MSFDALYDGGRLCHETNHNTAGRAALLQRRLDEACDEPSFGCRDGHRTSRQRSYQDSSYSDAYYTVDRDSGSSRKRNDYSEETWASRHCAKSTPQPRAQTQPRKQDPPSYYDSPNDPNLGSAAFKRSYRNSPPPPPTNDDMDPWPLPHFRPTSAHIAPSPKPTMEKLLSIKDYVEKMVPNPGSAEGLPPEIELLEAVLRRLKIGAGDSIIAQHCDKLEGTHGAKPQFCTLIISSRARQSTGDWSKTCKDAQKAYDMAMDSKDKEEGLTRLWEVTEAWTDSIIKHTATQSARTRQTAEIDEARVQAITKLWNILKPDQILGVVPTASSAKIHKAYRSKSLIYHPDKPGGDCSYAPIE
ncbi:hypothetical protein DL93DRAFT_2092294 [Clavulina sp. PMI_390]|nr:hypothetical protein DL93DRAFT_2092294 [Clavulina sp. PMI_390]